MAVESVPDQQKPTETPERWLEWFLYRLHQEPWALGGIVVIAVFLLATLSLVMFALLYGCCCGPTDKKQRTQQKKSNQGGVI